MARDLQRELAENVACLEAGVNAAMTSLELIPDDFARLIGKVTRSTVLPGRGVEDDSFFGHADLYGGLSTGASSGFIRARVSELIPEGGLYRATHNRPSSHIPRLFAADKGRIIIDTPTLVPGKTDGPVVIEGSGDARRYRKVTTYHTETGDVTVRYGERATCGSALTQDNTREVDVFILPVGIRSVRLATLARTITNVSCIFERIAWGDAANVSWEVEKESSRR